MPACLCFIAHTYQVNDWDTFLRGVMGPDSTPLNYVSCRRGGSKRLGWAGAGVVNFSKMQRCQSMFSCVVKGSGAKVEGKVEYTHFVQTFLIQTAKSTCFNVPNVQLLMEFIDLNYQ